MTDLSHTALIVLDTQVGAIDTNFWGTARSNPSFESHVSLLLKAFRSVPSTKIIHIHHHSTNPLSPLHPSQTGIQSHSCASPLPDEPIFVKTTNSAFILPDVSDYLKKKEIWRIYWVGLSLNWCLGSTIRSAGDLGVVDRLGEGGEVIKGENVLVDDAVAAWAKHGGRFDAETVHAVNVDTLEGEFVRVVKAEDVLREIGVDGTMVKQI